MKKKKHAAYREYIASHFITTSLLYATCTLNRQQTNPKLEHGRLKGKHFPMKMVSTHNENKTKRKYPAKFATLHNNKGITTCILDQACQQSTQHLHAIYVETYLCV